jgi:DNA-binding NtrC family response regulator
MGVGPSESLLIGASAAMARLRAQIVRFAPTGLPILIQGPTGTGKELVARALHLESRRRGNFVAFNVCAVSESMFEDALFGHVRGAFTGASAEHAGYLAEANGGTLFLDEIGGAGLAAQAKLLRAIETASFRPVGAACDRVSDFRTIAAANEPLHALVGEGRFREDLFHRLAGVVLDVPPLSARPEDIAALSQHFLAAFRPHDTPTLTVSAIDRLSQHAWPGNVRELKHTVERAAILARSPRVDRDAVEQAIGTPDNLPQPTTEAPASVEREQLLRILIESGWDTAIAAERLGIHRATVYRRMRALGIGAGDRSIRPPPPAR